MCGGPGCALFGGLIKIDVFTGRLTDGWMGGWADVLPGIFRQPGFVFIIKIQTSKFLVQWFVLERIHKDIYQQKIQTKYLKKIQIL